jgi:hypothetical protein
MLALEPIRPGKTYPWLIEQIVQEERESSDRSRWRPWRDLLASKRRDHHYHAVVASISMHGFIRPLNADLESGELQLSDGHHRLAAAMDLAMETVPVFVSRLRYIDEDSGEWESGDHVPDHFIGEEGGW